MRLLIMILFTLLATTAIAASNSKQISEGTFSGVWPFTVSKGIVSCEVVYLEAVVIPDFMTIAAHFGEAVYLSANGKKYPVNGNAKDHLGIDNKEIRKRGTNSSAFIDFGLKLCK